MDREEAYRRGYSVRIHEELQQGQTVRFRAGFHRERAGQFGTILAIDNFNFSQSREYRILLLASGQVLSFIDESEIESYASR